MANHELVLVTGASGYLAMHVINEFLNKGFKVRGTVRSLKDEKKIQALRKLGSEENLELVEADLLDKDSWKNTMKDVNIVNHVASPFPIQNPSDENELIRPALEGTLNVLNAAFDAKVKRVVLTSSTISIIGYNRQERMYTEQDWPDPNKQLPYGKSKILAEKAAWDFVEDKKASGQECFDLAVINPSFILGPTLHGAQNYLGTSETRVLHLFEGYTDIIPRINFPICDVRDVALAHFKAAFSTDAIGNRHAILTVPEFISLKEIAEILREEFEPRGYKILEQEAQGVLVNAKVDNSRFLNVLGINPIPLKKTIIDMANSFIEAGILKKN